MNALELADELANVGWDKPFSNWELLDQAATMLRQQQEQIEVMISILEQEGIGVGRDLLNGGIALFRKA